MCHNPADFKEVDFRLPEGVKPWHISHIPFSQRNIKVQQLETMLHRYSFHKDEKAPIYQDRTICYEYDAIRIYYVYQETTITALYLSPLKEPKAWVIDLLLELGSTWNLVASLGPDDILVDLHKREQVIHYFSGPLKKADALI